MALDEIGDGKVGIERDPWEDLVEQWEQEHFGWEVVESKPTHLGDGYVVPVRDLVTGDVLTGVGNSVRASFAAVSSTITENPYS